MRIASLFELGDVIELFTEIYGDDYPIHSLQQLVMSYDSKVILSDSGDSAVVFLHMYEGKYHMHMISRVGGKDMADLLREAIVYLFSVIKAKVLFGFVPERKIRLLIGMNSKVRPVTQVNGEWLYVLTKDEEHKIWQQEQQ